MAITAALVKELRERSGAGMMDCKKALTETNGDLELALEELRKKGMAKADKKAGRVAADGVIVIESNDDNTVSAIVEVNCETDFVAKGDEFQAFAKRIAEVALADQPADIDALMALNFADGETIDDKRRALIAKIGENMSVRRFEIVTAAEGSTNGFYQHGTNMAVVVNMTGGNADLAKDIGMHVVATNPAALDESGVSQEMLDKEKEIFTAQAKESGKPDEIIAKMIDGRMKKFLKEITLVNQPFVKNPDITVAQLLKDGSATVNAFVRYEVGEGIEVEETDFAAEVAAQAAAAAAK